MIAWCRICRPGSILGPQQHFLIHNESKLMEASSTVQEGQIVKSLLEDNELDGITEKEKEISIKGEEGQAAALLNRKKALYGI